jgi:uncharacterized circularly permuted ATP-grasp superfamily protein/uncharacterized alpha-E superfamily protein
LTRFEPEILPLPGPALPWDYQPRSGSYDEWFEAHGQLRHHCRSVALALERLGADELRNRRESARRILRDHGVNCGVFGDRQGLERPWDLDLLPLPISPHDWRILESGLLQRSRLLHALLADCYGPQRLVADGIVPSALLHANPAFLYPAHQLRPAHDLYLFHHAADLGRSIDGQWRILSHHTQSPEGTGYALENRLVLLRVLPEEFRTCQVRRLAAYFQHQRDALSQLTSDPAQPRIVVLTPGPASPVYFEHAYLARYLAFPLVEGTDLTVRNSRVFLKTLEGLQPVDVILRRVADAQCDPLELDAQSHLGIPGLLQAVRAGTVAVANPIGAALAEAPAWLAFLPDVCRYLLQEDLCLPSVATWWCGQPRALAHVLDHLTDLVIRPAFQPDADPVIPGQLNPDEQERLVHSLHSQPYRYVGQEQTPHSRAPTWTDRRCESHALLLRAFVCHGPHGAQVMPGGLTRLGDEPDAATLFTRSGGASKDTWVLSEVPVAPVSLVRTPTTAIRLERSAAEVPSRVADNLFWMGRYAERLEDTLRILRCSFTRLAGEASFESTPDLRGLALIMVRLDLLPERFANDDSLVALERESLALLLHTHRLGSVRELASRLHRLAWNVRDRLSADTWRALNQLQNDSRPHTVRLPLAEGLALLHRLIADLAALAGLEMENMTRGHAWRFLQIGRRIERAANIATLAQAGLHVEPTGLPIFEPMLEIADSTMTYRRLYFAQPLLAGVLDLLLADDANPRSLAFQLQNLMEHISNLPDLPGVLPPQSAPNTISRACTLLDQASFDRLDPVLTDQRRAELIRALDQIVAELRQISNEITHHFFSHTETRVC